MRRWIVILFSGVAITVGSVTQAETEQQVKQATVGAISDDGELSVGGMHACGIKSDGTVACWGDNSKGQLSGIPSGTFTQISAGNDHTCGVKSDGTIVCWGSNLFGQLTATAIPSGTFTQVSNGTTEACAIKRDGTLACWEFEQAPPNGAPWTPDPTRSLRITGQGLLTNIPSGTFTQVSVGGGHACALKREGTLACWGRYIWAFTPIPSGTFTQISAGGSHTCGVRSDGTLACWGNNSAGQLNNVPPETFTQVSAGDLYTCGVKRDGTLACWGDDRNGQLINVPSETFTQVSTRAFHSCALKRDGSVVCWGDNSNGQLINVPSVVFGYRAVSAVPSTTTALRNMSRWFVERTTTIGSSPTWPRPILN